MEDNNLKSFSLTALFMVTGFSSFIFYVLLNMMDGTKATFFIWTGCAGIVAGFIAFAVQLLNEKETDRRRKRRDARMNDEL